VLVEWARNMRAGYVNLKASGVKFDGNGGDGYIEGDYSPEEKLCLNEMTFIRVNEVSIYKVAELEYINQAMWLGDCRIKGGWYDNDMTKYEVIKPTRLDYLNYIHRTFGINKNTYYRRLDSLQSQVYKNVVMM